MLKGINSLEITFNVECISTLLAPEVGGEEKKQMEVLGLGSTTTLPPRENKTLQNHTKPTSMLTILQSKKHEPF